LFEYRYVQVSFIEKMESGTKSADSSKAHVANLEVSIKTNSEVCRHETFVNGWIKTVKCSFAVW